MKVSALIMGGTCLLFYSGFFCYVNDEEPVKRKKGHTEEEMVHINGENWIWNALCFVVARKIEIHRLILFMSCDNSETNLGCEEQETEVLELQMGEGVGGEEVAIEENV
ncbi:uncharacterized protein G2W53_002196 [Senna tora]|uniref:Uncharacterized protein n=1 Tax=Senna tora TaxID=362788 RepID=A0A835CJ94_9FABA|nr:uncharacterized protein G2W53_002196 [Senna tora]